MGWAGDVTAVGSRVAKEGRRLFRHHDGGSIAVIFALVAIPLIAFMGVALDYARASSMRTSMQEYSDAAALTAAVDKTNNAWNSLNEVLSQFREQHPDDFTSFSIITRWTSADEFEIAMSATMRTMILNALPGFGGDIPVSIRSVAKILPKPVKKPEVLFLDGDAADYNRIYVYCFDKNKKNEPDKGRRDLTAISDNAGTVYNYTMPGCTGDETLSVMLHNVAWAKNNRAAWEGPRDLYRYYSDTVIEDGIQKYDFGGSKILEAIVCDTLAQCKPKNQGGIIPTGSNRTPKPLDKECDEDKYIYYGWEDRPPPRDGSDSDYNDIRIIFQCPQNPEFMVVLYR
ncbi:hypothetical protein GCM10007276_11610 [Agaricicola taiwanensis]|uniref:Putative Flp pilus-assembly TadG-like N-terminal domain-containing protein n=1 Tax=Agaricicola taiwanensis TaxID=591372 RepID=A0A8J2VLC5_9RHOB|nr:Tad domain-containing protein [Agaricicola taiwanensis]GGE35837.1 hypothetical protein GCM10007276_11610 [Agaricicola taiwanensis]